MPAASAVGRPVGLSASSPPEGLSIFEVFNGQKRAEALKRRQVAPAPAWARLRVYPCKWSSGPRRPLRAVSGRLARSVPLGGPGGPSDRVCIPRPLNFAEICAGLANGLRLALLKDSRPPSGLCSWPGRPVGSIPRLISRIPA